MAITPEDIEAMTFSEAKKHGYSTEEVDAFLDQLSSEVDAMIKKIADLKGRLTTTEQQLAASQAQVAQLRGQSESAAEFAPAPASYAQDAGISASERQISQVLIVAQQSADRLIADARANADTIRSEADQKAREVIRQALAEKQTEMDEIDRLKQSREEFRGEYKKLLQHFMDDADSVFPEKTLNVPNGSAPASPLAAPVAPVPPSQPAPVTDSDATTFAPITDTNFNDLD
ncbi:DivIVA domain-containing protein [Olsenella sp. HMSC062G07]|uniref:DivIVA domain-containing protein n=1 Tax=Olsenella sp. HMSC062G07 TaxID=1739330 RepID=UPI0008A209B1|nr:DivIVA domain-containing protein [Olsenella sp. HMSC062G07]OFK24881.1 cell division protein DivIVA [Olsenella sp. HMSC062G07]